MCKPLNLSSKNDCLAFNVRLTVALFDQRPFAPWQTATFLVGISVWTLFATPARGASAILKNQSEDERVTGEEIF
jgi:hypothetical protein